MNSLYTGRTDGLQWQRVVASPVKGVVGVTDTTAVTHAPMSVQIIGSFTLGIICKLSKFARDNLRACSYEVITLTCNFNDRNHLR